MFCGQKALVIHEILVVGLEIIAQHVENVGMILTPEIGAGATPPVDAYAVGDDNDAAGQRDPCLPREIMDLLEPGTRRFHHMAVAQDYVGTEGMELLLQLGEAIDGDRLMALLGQKRNGFIDMLAGGPVNQHFHLP